MPRDPIVGMTVDIRRPDGTCWPAFVTAVNGVLITARCGANGQSFVDIPLQAGGTFYLAP
jgi:hypothetical protein